MLMRQASKREKPTMGLSSAKGHPMLNSSFSPPGTTLEDIHSVVNSFLIINSFADISSPKTREFLSIFRLEIGSCQVREICPQSDLSGKALYLRPYEYWSHITHAIIDLGISTRTYADNKTLSIKPAYRSNPSCKDHPDFQ
jgi:hypothetical protein